MVDDLKKDLNVKMIDPPPVRRRNPVKTRSAILESARKNFARDGYDGVGVREIATAAGVDSALISRYFGGKEGLFRAVLESATRPGAMYCGDAAAFSARMAELMVGEDSDPPELDQIMIAVRSASSPKAAEILRQMADEKGDEPVAQWMGDPDGIVRARLLGAILMGLGAARAVSPNYRLEPQERWRLQEKVGELIFALIANSLPKLPV